MIPNRRNRRSLLWLASLWVLLASCRSMPRSAEDLNAELAVSDLVSACEELDAEGAEEKARAVLQSGNPALPFLQKAWDEALDADVMVWTRACIHCIRRGMTLEQYRDALKKLMADKAIYQGNSTQWMAAVVHVYMLGDVDAGGLMSALAGKLAEQTLSIDLTTIDVLTHGGKRLMETVDLEMLASESFMVRDEGYRGLYSIGIHDPSYDPKDPPEKRRVGIQRLREIWETQRPEQERIRNIEWIPNLKKRFPGLRPFYEPDPFDPDAKLPEQAEPSTMQLSPAKP